MRKLAKVGYRVAPMYNDEPNGTIIEVINEAYVMVKWDRAFSWKEFDHVTREQVKYLRVSRSWNA